MEMEIEMEKKNITKKHSPLLVSSSLPLLHGPQLHAFLFSLFTFSLILCFLFPFLFPFLPGSSFAADDSLCARVKIEIKQELTLERQAFDAHMRINNGLSNITLENVNIDVTFADQEGSSVLASSDPDNTSALFFIRLDTMQNINNVSGSGAVAPSSSADIHWLIIPALGAAKGPEQGSQGTLYYVGATLTYTIGGEEHKTTVTPDYIFVKPMPELTLDYFLPTDVYGDDAFTQEIEPVIPFNLGVRVKNSGFGVARSLKIDSAQPKIVENKLGLLIGFVIEGSEVNGQAATNSLLADFGDIASNTSGVARWIMTCTLSGQFVEFKAEYSHSNELGGELTSLLKAANTHFLVHDVLVDLAGRDKVRDFLARDSGVYRVYESENMDTLATDQSSSATLQPAGPSGAEASYTLTAPVTAGFMYVHIPDPLSGVKVLKGVVRSDGKQIKPDNAWLAKTRNEDHTWRHFIDLFDVNTTGNYTVIFEDASAQPDPPVLQFIPDRTRMEGRQLSFLVEASDPDGTIPSLTADPLPALARFTDQGHGQGIFDWTPQFGQAGRYEVTFTASDGILKASRRATLTISSLIADSDEDGLPDDWELEHFGNLNRDGTGDFDDDGLTDQDEYAYQTDPAVSNAPTVPLIISPGIGTEVAQLLPDLTIQNSTDPDRDGLTYSFELYSDQGLTSTSLVASQAHVPETTAQTSWTVPQALQDNAWYYWRVRASDGRCLSQWAYGNFFVNTVNDPPGAFQTSSPQNGSEVDSQKPLLQITNSTDADGDTITYAFEVYADSGLNTLIASASGIPQGQDGATSWTVGTAGTIGTALNDNTRYFWKAVAVDTHGAKTETQPASFFVNTGNDAPGLPVILSPAIGSELKVLELDLAVTNATDVDGDSLSYFFELDRVNTFDGAAKQTSGQVDEGTDNSTRWHVIGINDNTRYYWRVKASDGSAQSNWVQGSFMVNTANDSPETPTLKNPGDGAQVQTLTPQLEVNPSVDIDHDRLSYHFEVFSEAGLTALVAQGQSDMGAWTVSLALQDNTRYYWRCRAEDEHGAASGWMSAASFLVSDNGVEDPPVIDLVEPSDDLVTNGTSITSATSVTIRWDDGDPDSNADIALYYDSDSSGEDGALIVEGIKEDSDGNSDAYTWDISSLEEGTYYLYAKISDGTSSTADYAHGAVIIDQTKPQVEATPAGGTYEGSQSVTLQANETACIYYTLNGNDPTTASLTYSTPIMVAETASIKFMAIDTAGNQGNVATETYIIQPGPQISGFTIEVADTITIQAGVAFPVTITALDSQGNVVSGFAGCVSLSVSGGSINPAVTGQFIHGVWEGQIKITGIEGAITLTASAGNLTGRKELLVTAPPPPSGITVSQTSGLTTTEADGAGHTATFTMVLASQPSAEVTIALSSSDTTEGTVSPASLTFTPANWNTPQIVTVTAVDDHIDDGDIAYTIMTAAAVSTDPGYNGLNPADVSVTTANNPGCSYSFNAGWNLITLSHMPDPAYTAATLVNAINNQGGSITKVQRWDGSGWKTYSAGAPFGNFTIEPGKGYFLLSNGPSQWSDMCDSFGSITYAFASGWNLFGFPTGGPYTAKSLSQAINERSGSIIKVQRWDGSGWKTYSVGAPFGDFALNSKAGYFLLTTAPSTFDISPFKISNVRDNQFTVSWTSDSNEYASVNYGVTAALGQTAPDDRGHLSSITHHVTISGLFPNTKYYYEIVSGSSTFNNNGNYFTITAGPSIIPAGSVSPAGQVFQSDGATPAQGAIVYITLKDIDGQGSTGSSAVESVLVDNGGFWSVELINIRKTGYQSLFSFTENSDHIVVEVNGGAGKKAWIETEAIDWHNGASPRPSITLP